MTIITASDNVAHDVTVNIVNTVTYITTVRDLIGYSNLRWNDGQVRA